MLCAALAKAGAHQAAAGGAVQALLHTQRAKGVVRRAGHRRVYLA